MKSLIIAPHCSTGGMPAYVEQFMKQCPHEFHFAEFKNYSDDYTVQRDNIRKGHDWSCHNGNEGSLISLIDDLNPDLVHFQEEPTSFLTKKTVGDILQRRGRWIFVLTSHERDLDYSSLPYKADRYIAVCHWQARMIHQQIPSADVVVWEYPITRRPPPKSFKRTLQRSLGMDPKKKHLVQLGLWTAHKRQDWTIDAARHLPDSWEVHFVGNRAPNMEDYWSRLTVPSNCKVWGERRDIDKILKAADAFVLPSTKELAPISLREALSAGLPCFISPLEVYEGSHADDDVSFIDLDDPKSLADALNERSL